MEKMDFPMTENSVLTSNQCEAMNRINKEQQDWQEMAVDKAFLIGRDIQKAKVYDMARGMMGLGNFELLPEFRSKFTPKMGEDLLRRLGSTPSFENIVSRHKETRNLSRHAGSGRPVLNVVNEELEDDTTEVAVNVDEVEINETPFDSVVVAASLNDSKELQEIGEEFDLDESFEKPEEELPATQINPVNSVAPVNVQSTPKATPNELPSNVARFVTPTNRLSTPVATPTQTRFESNNDVSEPAGCDEITYIPSLDAYFSPGNNFPTSVQLKKNLCSQCGYCPPRNWCNHLRNAGIKAGMKIKSKTPILKSLTMLRKKQRIDKTKSGKKAPRRFDIVPLHKEINTIDECEEISLELHSSFPATERNSYDDTIDAVVNAAASAYDKELDDPIPQSKRKLSFDNDEVDESENRVSKKSNRADTNELDIENIPITYNCSYCGLESTSWSQNEEHVESSHNHSCAYCDLVTRSVENLQQHEMDHVELPVAPAYQNCDSSSELNLILEESECETTEQPVLTIKSVDNGLYDILDLPIKRKKKPVYMKHYSVALLPRIKK